MTLIELLNIIDIKPVEVILKKDFIIKGLTFDSRAVVDDTIFFAIKGYKDDGNKYISDAICKNAGAVITDRMSFDENKEFFESSQMNVIVCENVRKFMAVSSNAYYGYPSKKIKLIGVTGTNGKTTITYIIKRILETAGNKCGLIGTIDYITGANNLDSKLTTPDSIEINQLLSDMAESGMEYCVMEVSSIALLLDRVYKQDFHAGIFTNLTSEHMDLHGNMEDYFKSKKILFDILDSNKIAISNLDDEFGEKILNDCKCRKIFYSLNKEKSYRAEGIDISIEGISFNVVSDGYSLNIKTRLTGGFNVYNILAAVAFAREEGIDDLIIQKALESIDPINGRFNKIKLPNNSYAIIDYSHTSDSLKNAISAARYIRNAAGNNGRVITIFGCGGNKDITKRPLMGKYASELSDYVIITSDNPRSEDPMEIIRDIMTGIEDVKNVEIEENRELAIKKGIWMSAPHDIILICGKGHETYQEIKGVKSHFDDKEIVEKYSLFAKTV